LPEPLVAREVETLDWDALPTHTTPLVFPGLATWTDLVSGQNAQAVRNLETTMWTLHGRGA
jgi:hypothetical protein